MTSLDPFSLLFSDATAADPHPAYSRLHGECPVARGDFIGNPTVFLSRYDDVLWALRHPEVFSSADDALSMGQEQPLLPLQVDPPLHTRYRRLLNPRFVPREVETLEPAVRALVKELVDAVVDEGACDFHRDIATPLPSTIFLRLLGLPLEDLPQFLAWRDATIRPDVAPGDFEAALAARAEAGHAIHDYFVGAIAEARRRPADDDALLPYLVRAEIDGTPLTDRELLGICHLLLLGGLDTVTASLDCVIAHLCAHPAQRDVLVAEPERWPAAIEELLRHQTPVQIVPRLLTQDFELGGVSMHAGDKATLVIGAANIDPEAWPEAGDVDLDRDAARHLGFGGGHHLCLGAHLARLEMRVALEEWHARVPTYRLADDAALRFSPGIRQVEALPLVW